MEACRRIFFPGVAPALQRALIARSGRWPRARAFFAHPAGPFTIHFWAPAFKWGITLANVADLRKQPEQLSLEMQLAVVLTGAIWARYSTVITPVNWNLFTVNAFMCVSGLAQLYRIATHRRTVQ